MTSSKTNKSLAELAARGWVSLSQFAEIIDVSYPTALRMKRAGEVEVVRVGGINRIYSDELTRFLSKGSRKEGQGNISPDLSSSE